MRKKGKRLSSLCLILLTVLLSACGGKALPEGFNKKELLQTSEAIVTAISEKNYEAVTAQLSASMAEQVDAQDMEEIVGDAVESLGDFEKITSSEIAGASTGESGDFASVMVVCQYENGEATYTINIDREGKICGLYLKK